MPDRPTMKLWRLDGGRFHVALDHLTDTFDYPGQSRTLTNACYLIQRGAELTLFDTGFPQELGSSLDVESGKTAACGAPIVEQLGGVGFDASQVTTLILSHCHLDHTGQARSFHQARLLLGGRDVDWLTTADTPYYCEPGHLGHWLSGGGDTVLVEGDLDIFGDGSVVMLALPGHTPGHHGLLVRLPHTGPVLLCADTVHFAAQRVGRVPAFNDSRADSLASIDRVNRLASSLGATVVATHDPDDVVKLPLSPAAAD